MTTGPRPHRPPLAHGMCAKCMVTEDPEPGQGPPSPLPSATTNHTLETSATDSQAEVKAAGYLPEEARGRRGGSAHEIYVQMSTMEENDTETGKEVRHRRPSSRQGGKGTNSAGPSVLVFPGGGQTPCFLEVSRLLVCGDAGPAEPTWLGGGVCPSDRRVSGL